MVGWQSSLETFGNKHIDSMTQSKRGWAVCFFWGGCTIPPIAGPGMAHGNVRMKSRWLTRGPMHVTYTKRAPEGRRDRNSTMLSSLGHTGHVALLLAMSALRDLNWACCNSATPPPARPKFCIDLAWGVTNNWQKIWPGRRGAAKAPRVHPHRLDFSRSCYRIGSAFCSLISFDLGVIGLA